MRCEECVFQYVGTECLLRAVPRPDVIIASVSIPLPIVRPAPGALASSWRYGYEECPYEDERQARLNQMEG